MFEKTERDRLRIAMIVTGFPTPENPNLGNFNARAVEALRSFVEITVIYLRAWKPGRRASELSRYNGLPVLTITVPQVPRCFRMNLKTYKYLGWRLVRPILESCDIIHSVDAAFSGVLGSAWGRRARVRHVTQLVGGETTSMFSKKDVWRTIAGWEKHLQGVASNSEKMAAEFAAYYPSARNIRTVYRGVDLANYTPEGPVAGPLADERPVRFLFLGGFPPCAHMLYGANTKGGKTLLEAWQKAENELYEAGSSLLIAGPDCDTSELKRWRAGLKHPDRVHLAGRIHPELVAKYIRASDSVLIPSMEEGLPNVALEAAACGRAVFGSDAGGIPEVVVNEETGLILPAGDVDAWKNALVVFAKRPMELERMGQQARGRMEKSFDSRNYATEMLALYALTLKEPLGEEAGTLFRGSEQSSNIRESYSSSPS